MKPFPISPMLAKAGRLPEHPEDYAFEIKWDGLRAVAYLAQGKIRLLSRNLKDITAQYPEIAQLGEMAADRLLVLDGEIIALDEDGKPSFARLQHRMGLRSPLTIRRMLEQIPTTFMLFDLLHLDDRSLLALPYTERRIFLAELNLQGPGWQTPAYYAGEGAELLAASRSLRLEGIIAKRLDSVYEAGRRTGAWLKIKNQRRQELVIGGWVAGEGKRQGTIGAILVGYYDPQAEPRHKLQFAGKVGTGFSSRMLADLEQRFSDLATADCPFVTPPPLGGAHYLKPLLVGDFEFTEWTPRNTLRHPSFKGLRFDKPPADVIRETE